MNWTTIRLALRELRANKLRTFLTGFSVAWGIFMLVILLGSGNGLKNGVLANFGTYATNTVSISGGWTSQAYAGYGKWRHISLKNNDLKIFREEFPEIVDVAGTSWYRGSTASYGERFADIGAARDRFRRGVQRTRKDGCRRTLFGGEIGVARR